MGKDGSQQASSTLASVRSTPKICSRPSSLKRITSSVPKGPVKFADQVLGQSETVRSRNNAKSVNRKELYKGDGSERMRFLFTGISGEEKVGRVASSDRSSGTKQLSVASHVRYGHAFQSQGNSASRNVGNIAGSLGCLSSHPDGRISDVLPLLPDRRQTVHVSSPTVRPDVRSLGVHGGNEAIKALDNSAAVHTVPVSRRLVESAVVVSGSGTCDQTITRPVRDARTSDKLREIRTGSHSETGISGRNIGFRSRTRFPNDSSTKRDLIPSQQCVISTIPVIPSGGIVDRTTDIRIQHSSTGEIPYAAPTVSVYTTSAQGTSSPSTRPDITTSEMSPSLVVAGSSLDRRHTVSTQPDRVDSVYRCVDKRLGRGVSRSVMERLVESVGPTHQLARIKDSVDSSSVITIPTERQDSVDANRQLHSSSIHKESGRDSVPILAKAHGPDTTVSGSAEDPDSASSHHRTAECISRPGVTNAPSGSIGMVAVSRTVPMAVTDVTMGTSSGGPLCESAESSPSTVHVSVSGRRGRSDKRAKRTMAERSAICVSPSVPAETVVKPMSATREVSDATSDTVESTRKVGSHPKLAQHPFGRRRASKRSVGPSASLGVCPSKSPKPKLKAVVSPREKLKEDGFSARVIDRVVTARALSTTKHYMSQWRLFEAWATNSKRDPLNASLPLLAEFLEYLFKDRKVSVPTILNYKTSIAHFWKEIVHFQIPDNDTVISDMIRAFKRARPKSTKHVVEWDIHRVLSFFQSGRFKHWDSLSDEELTYKTVFLLALASGKRRGEIHALDCNVKWVKGEDRAVDLSPSPDFLSKTHIKTGGVGALKTFRLQSLDNLVASDDTTERLLCPVRTLKYYLDRTKVFRSKEQTRLIIPFNRGSDKDLTKFTISNYIKKAVTIAYASAKTDDWVGQKPVKMKAHSVRHVATSLAALKVSSMDDILRAGAWVSSNVFLSHYIQSYTVDDMSKLSRLGGFVAAGALI